MQDQDLADKYHAHVQALNDFGTSLWDENASRLRAGDLDLAGAIAMLVSLQMLEQLSGAEMHAGMGRLSAASANLRAGIEAVFFLAYVARPDDHQERDRRAIILKGKGISDQIATHRRLRFRIGDHGISAVELDRMRECLAVREAEFVREHNVEPGDVNIWDLCKEGDLKKFYIVFMSDSHNVHTNISELDIRARRLLAGQSLYSEDARFRVMDDVCVLLFLGLDAMCQLLDRDRHMLRPQHEDFRATQALLNERYPLERKSGAEAPES